MALLLRDDQRLFVMDGTLPGLNDYVDACRAHRQSGAKMKHKAEMQVYQAVQVARVRPIEGLVHVSFRWVERARRRDKDNIAFAKKFVLDVLRPYHPKQAPLGMGIIGGDGWRHVDGFSDSFGIDKERPRLIVLIEAL